MTSNLSISEFKGRMKYHTKIGDPILKMTPFILFTIFTKTGKKFYGGFNDSQFELTKNAEFWPIPYIIKGTYRAKSKSETELAYEIKTVKFFYWLIRIIPLTILILINYLLITNSEDIHSIEILLLNVFLLLLFVPLLIIKHMKNRMERNFKEIFRVEN